jgi:hypothetical protein
MGQEATHAIVTRRRRIVTTRRTLGNGPIHVHHDNSIGHVPYKNETRRETNNHFRVAVVVVVFIHKGVVVLSIACCFRRCSLHHHITGLVAAQLQPFG